MNNSGMVGSVNFEITLLSKSPTLGVVHQGEQWDSAPHSFILAVDVLGLSLRLLLDQEVVLMQVLQMGYHAPIVELPGTFFSPGNIFATVVALSNMRLGILHSEVLPQWGAFWSHDSCELQWDTVD